MNTKAQKRGLVWGGLLILTGLMSLAQLWVEFSEWVGIGILAAAGVAVLVVYLTDRSMTEFLILAYAMLCMAGLLALTLWEGFSDDIIAVSILPIIALPFLAVYLRNRDRWWPLLTFYGLIIMSVIIWLEEFTRIDDAVAPLLILPGIGLPFLVVYLRDREKTWALITAYALGVMSIVIGLDELSGMNDEIVPLIILPAIGLPFLIVYLRDRSRGWALIPFYVLTAIGIMIGVVELTDVREDTVVPVFVFFATAIPFLYAYARNRRNWWALLVGGFMALIGIVFLWSETLVEYVGPAALILIGIWIVARQFTRKAPEME